jgi:hypothetical protein
MLSLDEISDRLELQHLLISYSEAIDRREFDELDAIFTPDAYIDYRDTGGIEGQYLQIKAWLADVLPAISAGTPTCQARRSRSPATPQPPAPSASTRWCSMGQAQDHAGRRLVRRRVRPHRRRLADVTPRRDQVLRQGAVTRFPSDLHALAQWQAVCPATTAARRSHT